MVEKIRFVGAGPGDPELITVRGRRLLEEAHVVVYAGSLVSLKVLKWCRKETELFDSAEMDLLEITGVMVEAAKAGKKVVRLHTGDTAFYSAAAEQMEVLDGEGVGFDVTPGVNAASAAAAALGTGFTIPEVCQTVIFTRAPGRTSVPGAEKLSELARHGATMCIFLSVAMIEDVVEELGAGGYDAETPVAVVYRASWEDEVIVRGTLGDIAAKVKEAGITRHAVIIVGKALAGMSGKQSRLYAKEFKHGYRN